MRPRDGLTTPLTWREWDLHVVVLDGYARGRIRCSVEKEDSAAAGPGSLAFAESQTFSSQVGSLCSLARLPFSLFDEELEVSSIVGQVEEARGPIHRQKIA